MAVVPRVYKKFTTYYAVNTWHGKQVAERVGRNKREADARDSAMKREIEAGTYEPPASRARDTVDGFGTAFFDSRTNGNAENERSRFRRFVLARPWLAKLHLDDWKPSTTEKLLGELRGLKKPDGSRQLKDKSIGNFFNELSLMFDAAVRLEKCLRNPIVLAPNELKRSATEEVEIYEVGEIAVLIRHHSIPWPVRVLTALCFFTGMREGEACGRRWRDLDDRCLPLGGVSIHDQYGGQKLKTERPRVCPLHPGLVEILTAWAQEGFELYTGRLPTPDDFIVPAMSKRATKPYWTRSMFYKAFVKHAEAAGVRPRSVHATRHSFITHAQRGGADKKILEKATHNAAGEMIDRYTHGVWKPICDAVLCFSLEALPELHSLPRFPGKSGGGGPSFLPQKSRENVSISKLAQGSIPGASTPAQHKRTKASGPRKFSLQATSAADLREGNRTRKRRLLSLAEADPESAAAPLAITRALDAAYQGDEPAMLKQLAKAYHSLGLDDLAAEAAASRAGGGQ